MRRNYEREKAAKELMMLDVEVHEIALTYIDQIKEVMKSFDGKVFNKKVQEKLSASLNNTDTREYFYIRNEASRFEIEYHYDYAKRIESDTNWQRRTLPFNSIYLMSWYKDYTNEGDKPVTEDKRMHYDTICAFLDERAVEIQERIDNLYKEHEMADSLMDRYYELYEEAGKFKNSLSYTFREYFEAGDFDRFYV